MRSASPPVRRLRHRGRLHAVLPAVAGVVDQATADDPDHVLVFVEAAHPHIDLGLKSIDRAVHPFEVLAGFTAPESWSAFGIRACGTARHLDDPAHLPARTAMTFLLDRNGQEASVLRLPDRVTTPPGPAHGTIPDVCRRVLGLPTAPAPSTTLELWIVQWLDRVLDRWSQPARRRDLVSSWGQVAVLHPAIHAPTATDVLAFTDPTSLVTAARSHAAAASWSDLRRSPLPLALPDGPLPPDIAAWMDDGFFARWTLGAFPPPRRTADELAALLGAPLGPHVVEVVAALLD